MADQTSINQLFQALDYEGAQQRAWPNGLWGPKTATDDASYYLPESLVGELPYRYQGVALHGALAGMPGSLRPLLQWFNAIRAFNAGYALNSAMGERTNPVSRAESQLPQPPSYPPEQPSLADLLASDQPPR